MPTSGTRNVPGPGTRGEADQPGAPSRSSGARLRGRCRWTSSSVPAREAPEALAWPPPPKLRANDGDVQVADGAERDLDVAAGEGAEQQGQAGALDRARHLHEALEVVGGGAVALEGAGRHRQPRQADLRLHHQRLQHLGGEAQPAERRRGVHLLVDALRDARRARAATRPPAAPAARCSRTGSPRCRSGSRRTAPRRPAAGWASRRSPPGRRPARRWPRPRRPPCRGPGGSVPGERWWSMHAVTMPRCASGAPRWPSRPRSAMSRTRKRSASRSARTASPVRSRAATGSRRKA